MPYARNILFVHIPRTAGTLIEREFLNVQGKWPTGIPKHLWGILKKNGRSFTGQHLTMRQIEQEKFLSKQELERCHVFSVVRNPYDRIRSLYRYWGGAKKWGSMQNFLEEVRELLNNPLHKKRGSIARYHVLPQVDYLENSAGRIQMIILKFEHLDEDFKKCFHRKISFNPNKKRTSVRLNDVEKSLIQEIYQADFNNLDYKT